MKLKTDQYGFKMVFFVGFGGGDWTRGVCSEHDCSKIAFAAGGAAIDAAC